MHHYIFCLAKSGPAGWTRGSKYIALILGFSLLCSCQEQSDRARILVPKKEVLPKKICIDRLAKDKIKLPEDWQLQKCTKDIVTFITSYKPSNPDRYRYLFLDGFRDYRVGYNFDERTINQYIRENGDQIKRSPIPVVDGYTEFFSTKSHGLDLDTGYERANFHYINDRRTIFCSGFISQDIRCHIIRQGIRVQMIDSYENIRDLLERSLKIDRNLGGKIKA